MERQREAAASKAVSDVDEPSGGETAGVGEGVGSATLVASGLAFSTVSAGFAVASSVFGMSDGVEDGFSGVAAGLAASGDGVAVASGAAGGLLEVGSPAVLAAVVALGSLPGIAGPILSSSPLSVPLILR